MVKRNNITKKIKIKPLIIISVEGRNKTERYYFENFNKREFNYNIKFADGNETDPLNLVMNLKDTMVRHGFDSEVDKAFCIFDMDVEPYKLKQKEEAIKFAKENNIVVLTSTPCFELWYLLHFDYTTKEMTNSQVIKNLSLYCKNYQKNIDIFDVLYPNVDKAIKNAKQLEKFIVEANNFGNSNRVNPRTEVYKLVEYLRSNK